MKPLPDTPPGLHTTPTPDCVPYSAVLPAQRHLRRRQLLQGLLCLGPLGLSHTAEAASAPLVEVWKDPQCGCCHDWIAHLQAHGFQVKAYDLGANAARARLGMPQALASCHTALVQGYVLEGHVPAADIQRLLRQRPKALGLAVPGMPVGSPGMDGPVYGDRRDPYQVLLVQHDRRTSVFNHYPQDPT